MLAEVIALILNIAIIFAACIGVSPKSWAERRLMLGLGRMPKGRDFGVGFVVCVIAACLNLLCGWIFAVPFHAVDRSALAAFRTIFVAPIAEELLFRGWMRGVMRQHRGVFASPIVIVVTTSLIFGVTHTSSLGAVVAATTGGVLFAISREKTGAIYVPMVAHILHNAVAVIYDAILS